MQSKNTNSQLINKALQKLLSGECHLSPAAEADLLTKSVLYDRYEAGTATSAELAELLELLQ